MTDHTSELTLRPQPGSRTRRSDDAWEAVVREELVKLRRRSPGGQRVVPASRRPQAPDLPDAAPPDA
jgi:hypothetical protein